MIIQSGNLNMNQKNNSLKLRTPQQVTRHITFHPERSE